MSQRNGTLSSHVPRLIPEIQDTTCQRRFISRPTGYGQDVTSSGLSQRMHVGWREESGLLHEERSGLSEEVGWREREAPKVTVPTGDLMLDLLFCFIFGCFLYFQSLICIFSIIG